MAAAFEANFAAGLEIGASVSVWRGGAEIVSLHAGWRNAARTEPWTPDTLVAVWSATKGLAAACAVHAMERRGVLLDTPVRDFWPEFGQSGKESVTCADVLSHSAGLASVDEPCPDLADQVAVAAALARQRPLWEQGHGYGARTFGSLADEFVRRLSGVSLADYWCEEFARPLGLDFWIGLPAAMHGRVAELVAPRPSDGSGEPGFVAAMAQPDSLTRRAFTNPGGLLPISRMNTATMRSASLPSLGGIGSASSLAKFYAMLATGAAWDGKRYFRETHVMSQPAVSGHDLVLQFPTAFSTGFMMNAEGAGRSGELFGPSAASFGHPGAGGSLAFADPVEGIGFAYVMNRMGPGVIPRARAQALVKAVYAIGP